MEQKEPFKKLTIEPKRKKEEVIEQHIDLVMSQIDQRIDEEVVKVLNELGYNDAKEGMTHEEAHELHERMMESGDSIAIETTQEGTNYIVKINIVQVARTLTFDLSQETSKEIENND